MIFLLILAFALSFGITFGVLIVSRSNAKNYGHDMPQRFHLGHTPRIGGLGMFLSFGLALFLAALSSQFLPTHFSLTAAHAFAWLAAASPVVLFGMIEDITQRVGVKWRLLAAVISASIAYALFNASVNRLGIPWIDHQLLNWPWFGIALAVFAITGLPHALNIIDGYNGLAGMVVVMICAALAYVSWQVGDRQLAAVMIALAGCTLGFLVWNYPRGLIFAGDGGAYFWGFVIALASILLVQKHSQVSPWFPMLLLIYPVWETIFSIYRKLSRGQSPGTADSMHFHQLVYKRLVRGVFHDNSVRQMLMRNNRTSPYLWAFASLTVLPAMLFWYSTPILVFFCGMFITSYVAAYLVMVRFKLPRWIQRYIHRNSNKKPPKI
jgi:UDP-GlcNAc:undecaprenyl-phosphate/decaprenyl-phosphate GlcNAc-1-phosphate transferase